ncbi:MAG: hypothetical protein ACON3Z_15175 [Bradymonadia bacterium]
MNLRLLAFVVVFSFVATPGLVFGKANSKTAKALRKACKKEINDFCKDKKNARAGQQLACLAKKASKLSPSCHVVAKTIALFILPKSKKKAKNPLLELAKHIRRHGTKAVSDVKEFTENSLEQVGHAAQSLGTNLAKIAGNNKEAKAFMACLPRGKKLQDLFKELRKLFQDPGKLLMDKFNSTWTPVRKAAEKHIRASKKPTNVKAIPKFAWNLQLKILNDASKNSDEIKLVACIARSLDPKFKQIEPKLQAMLQKVERTIKDKIEKEIIPMLVKEALSIVAGELNKSDFGKRVVEATKRVAGHLLLARKKIQNTNKKLAKYRQALAQKNKKRIRSAFKDLHADLQRKLEPARVTLLVLEGLLKEEADAIIDKKVTPKIDIAITAISSKIAALNGVIDGLCGLIPEAGAAVCTGFVTRVLRLANDWVISPQVRSAIIKMTKDVSRKAIGYARSIAYEHVFKKVDRRLEKEAKKFERKYGAPAVTFKQVVLRVVKTLEKYVLPAVAELNTQREETARVLKTLHGAAK